MDRFTQNRLRDEAILRAQDRASLRKPTRTIAGSPLRGLTPPLDAGLYQQPEPSVMEPRSISRHADQEGRI